MRPVSDDDMLAELARRKQALKWFVQEMDDTLMHHAGKGNWRTDASDVLFAGLEVEVAEARRELCRTNTYRLDHPEWSIAAGRTIAELVDVAVCALICADRLDMYLQQMKPQEQHHDRSP